MVGHHPTGTRPFLFIIVQQSLLPFRFLLFFLTLSCHFRSLCSCVVSNIRSCCLDLSKCFTNPHSPFKHRGLGPACRKREPSKGHEDATPGAIWASASSSVTLDREIMHFLQWRTQTCRMLSFLFVFFSSQPYIYSSARWFHFDDQNNFLNRKSGPGVVIGSRDVLWWCQRLIQKSSLTLFFNPVIHYNMLI